MLEYFSIFFFALKKLHTYGSWEIFSSAALTAQNSPELYFCFINSFIQSSLLRSLAETLDQMCQTVSYRYRDLNTVTATLVAFSSYRLFS